MKKKTLCLLLALGGLIVAPQFGQAQLLKRLQKNLEKHIENKADNVVDNLLNGKEEEPASESAKTKAGRSGKPAASTGVYDFVPGREVIFEDNMAKDAPGRMPSKWKTHSTGEVVSVEGAAGKWLRLESNASYQLAPLLQLPEKFTLEFDILTRSAEASDLRDILFGFSKNPTPKHYIYGSSDQTVINTELQFFYNNVATRSNDTGVENRVEFPLDNLGNARIPVAIEVNGTHMRVFVNRQSVLDTEALTLESPKYFFVSNDDTRDGAQAYIGNIRIAR